MSAHARRHLAPVKLVNGVVLVAAMVVALGLGELACRAFLADRLAVPTDERNLLYRYDATLGWFPVPSSDRSFLGERRIHVRHNSLGLRDVEFPPPAAGRPRLAFFGDSFVWGYDAEAEERFTDLLRRRHPEWDLMNCGVSGYGTDQAALLFERLGPLLQPDVVVLEFNRADRNDNLLTVNHGGDGKPAFQTEGDALTLVNVPVPLLGKARWAQSAFYRYSYAWRLLVGSPTRPPLAIMEDPSERIVDRMHAESAAAGRAFVLVLEGTDAAMVAHAAAHGIPLVEVDPALRAADGGEPLKYPGHGAHWTPAGHRVVADLLEPVLRRALIESVPKSSASAARR
jgi:lysophospholipase L1-like esterase